MNTEEGKEKHCSETEAKIDQSAKLESLESVTNLPTKSAQESCADQLPSPKTKDAIPDDASDDIIKSSIEGISETSAKHMEIGDGDHIKEAEDPIVSTADNTTACHDEEGNVPVKPTFVESVSSLNSEDVDSENQDEELVLKWDDDDEEGLDVSLKDDETDKILCTKSPDVTVKAPVENTEIGDLAVVKFSKDPLDPKSSEDDDDDLLSEIDAQIAELGASISKAENENLMNTDISNESKIPIEVEGSTSDSVNTLNVISNKDNSNKTDTESPAINIADNSEKSAIDAEEDLLKDDEGINNLITTKIETKSTSPKPESSIQMDVDSSNKSEGNIADKTLTTSEIEMDLDNSAYLENPNSKSNQNQQEDLPKNAEILANSTILDNSFGNGNDLEIPGQDTFIHDSCSSIEPRTHGINKPNAMLEIPTQELIDLDESVLLSHNKEMSLEDSSVDLTEDKDSANEATENNKNENIENKANTNITEEDKIIKTIKFVDTIENIQKPQDNVTSTGDSEIQNDITNSEDITKLDSQVTQVPTEKNDKTNEETNLNQNITLPDAVNLNNNLNRDENQRETAKNNTDVVKDATITENQTNAPVETVEANHEDSLLINIFASKEDTAKDISDAQPSTSQMSAHCPDPSDDTTEVTEATDSLGLLAESSRVRDEDDVDADGDGDGDEQETSDHDDYDDEFDPDDESSNQQTAEHSEDSAQHSETDMPKTQDAEKNQIDKPFDLLNTIDNDNGDSHAIEKDANELEGKENVEKEFGFEISNVVSEGTKEGLEESDEVNEEAKEGDGYIDIDDDIVCEEVEVSAENIGDSQVAEEVDTTVEADTTIDKDKNQTEDTNEDTPTKDQAHSLLRKVLQKAKEEQTKSPKKLEISQPKHVVNIVDLESSSEDEGVQQPTSEPDQTSVTSINISKEIEVMSVGDNVSDIISKEGETVINVPKKTPLKKLKSRLNTSEITIKTGGVTESTLVIPETKMSEMKEPTPTPSKFGELEVFNLDSDEEENVSPLPAREPTPEPEPEKPPNKCINSACTSDSSVPFYPADPSTAAYYDCHKKKRAMVCQYCLYEKVQRAQKLVEGIKNFTPLLDMEEVRCSQDLVEISDSDSDDEATDDPEATDKIGAVKAGILESQLADMINATWDRFRLDARLKDAEDQLALDMEKLEKESAEVNQMLDDCQTATDKLRCELYATFDVERHQLPGLIIYDTQEKFFICPEAQLLVAQQIEKLHQQMPNKRRLSSASESQAKKPAIPLGIAAEADKSDIATGKIGDPKSELASSTDTSKVDDDKDISVVTQSAEAAPADLPPTGEAVREPLQVNQVVFAMRHAFGSWIKARILEVTPKGSLSNAQSFTTCRVKFENKTNRNANKLLPARCLAYFEPSNVRMTIGTRVIALFKDTSADKSGKRESFYSGVVAEVPNPVNKYRYLVFFDDGYAQYVSHSDTRLVCEFSSLVWEEVHPFSREFVREYLLAYPERPMVRLHTGQNLKTEWNGKWWLSRVVQVDASLVQVYFEQDKRTEWIYRGSTRLAPLYLELQAAEKHKNRPLHRNRAQNKLNMPYVEYTRFDEQAPDPAKAEPQTKAQQEEIRRQRAVAKKSTTPQNLPVQPHASGNLDAVTSRVVYYTPKNAVKPYKMTTHTCGPKCKRTDVLALKDLRTYNPLAKPLLSGWERQIVRYKGHKEVMYRAPCGRRLRNMAELHRYLRAVQADMGVDLFDFGPNTHCLAEFVLNKCIVGKKDLSHGKENVPVPCVNYYDESLPEFCSYNTERTPTAGVPLNLDPEFLCGCDCTDDCQDKSKCACWKMTLEGARTIGLDGSRVGYVYKRLPDPLPSGIYECNVRCKCRSTCLNRVAQHPLQLKLQVFKTLNRGWGIRALNDVPKGSFLCIYAGNLLTDATANLDGLNEGDEYLAELDYIEVVEQMKEGYEDDIPEQDKKLDRKELGKQESSSEESESEEEAANSKSDADDGDFEPGFIPDVISGFNKRLRKREKKKQKEKEKENAQKDKDGAKEATEDDCITISDDEELREPSSFAAQAGMGREFISKYRSVRTLFGKDEACYIMDAKVQGNIGRYLNHSCSPNVFVQNVFVDTHDPRFPWVAFFALTHIRAGTELTWNYNYDVGSVPGKALYCYCGAPNCRGRLL